MDVSGFSEHHAFLRMALGITMKKIMLALMFAASALVEPAAAARIKDITTIQGVRENPLYGYGLVIGLDGTGDQSSQTRFTAQSIESMLTKMGVNLPPGINIQAKNVASVMVTASLPAFSKPGQAIDITVSSIGNAKSLKGGTLLMTPLKGADGNIYAVAQGSVIVGGAGAEAGGSSKKINHLSAGRIPEGAVVERSVPSRVLTSDTIKLELSEHDFGNIERIVTAINDRFAGAAQAVDARTVEIKVPEEMNQKIAFMSTVQALEINEVDAVAKVIVNSRTGSIAINQRVSLKPSAVSHGNLSVSIQSTPIVSQPNPFAAGETVTTSFDEITIKESGGELIKISGTNSLNDVVRGLNQLGASPSDLISILQALKQAGSLQASLEVI